MKCIIVLFIPAPSSLKGLLFKIANHPRTKLLKTIMSEINQLLNDADIKHIFSAAPEKIRAGMFIRFD